MLSLLAKGSAAVSRCSRQAELAQLFVLGRKWSSQMGCSVPAGQSFQLRAGLLLGSQGRDAMCSVQNSAIIFISIYSGEQGKSLERAKEVKRQKSQLKRSLLNIRFPLKNEVPVTFLMSAPVLYWEVSLGAASSCFGDILAPPSSRLARSEGERNKQKQVVHGEPAVVHMAPLRRDHICCHLIRNGGANGFLIGGWIESGPCCGSPGEDTKHACTDQASALLAAVDPAVPTTVERVAALVQALAALLGVAFWAAGQVYAVTLAVARGSSAEHLPILATQHRERESGARATGESRGGRGRVGDALCRSCSLMKAVAD
ncbi:hypothetical protein JZ751_020524 [Albula glossodonta]|uniref:Uncharacterized protein n=1 Tax=Albula glossodonta TaxID=121402 RepID=A0A8T2PLB5_9TELE|nr:hypothetical protein JZ751_020524 [Albula glossodonta]